MITSRERQRNAKGFGSVYLDKTRNKWIAKMPFRDLNGNRKTFKRGFSTEEEARIALVAVRKRRNLPLLAPMGNQPLALVGEVDLLEGTYGEKAPYLKLPSILSAHGTDFYWLELAGAFASQTKYNKELLIEKNAKVDLFEGSLQIPSQWGPMFLKRIGRLYSAIDGMCEENAHIRPEFLTYKVMKELIIEHRHRGMCLVLDSCNHTTLHGARDAIISAHESGLFDGKLITIILNLDNGQRVKVCPSKKYPGEVIHKETYTSPTGGRRKWVVLRLCPTSKLETVEHE